MNTAVNLLALDYGTRRVGAALRVDHEVFELPGFSYQTHHELKRKIIEWCDTYSVGCIIVGTPKFGIIPQYISQLIGWLEGKQYTVVMHGEDLTTKQANKELADHEVRSGLRRKVVDSVSARLILEDYLLSTGK